MEKIEFHNYGNLFKIAVEKLPSKNLKELTVKRLIIAGNGSVSNGWDPVKKVFLEKELVKGSGRIDLKKYVQENKTLEAIILITHLKRVFRSKLLKDKASKNDYSSSLEIIKNLNEFNNAIADEFNKSVENKSLKFQPEIKIIYDLLKTKEEFLETLFLTLNWDNLAWNDDLLGNVGYLHGNVLNPETMFMPSQYMSENFEFLTFHSLNPSFLTQEERIILLKGNKDIYLESIAQVFNNCFANCEELYLWGVGLNIYDTDLMVTLSVVIPEKLKKIVIINRNSDQNSITSQLKVMLPNYNGEIQYINSSTT
ncbi:hypothetical protein EHR01_10150 [Leptospira mtsangambouensis]|uniref:DUF4917 family protein n=1 Tax=Leptospira mtsangambouensis TaxID=2484912 RepID=A0ABY2NZ59_9LEPT|nr:hypothetical protein [Leptospira mtsangambouensis]TGM74768.1 hypothetical protein EHR01_10150 [Leptospira mtsangambouensis]